MYLRHRNEVSWDDLPKIEHPSHACREVERAAACKNLYDPIGSLERHLMAIANGCIHHYHSTVLDNLLEMVNQGNLILVGSLSYTVKSPLIRWQSPDPTSKDKSKHKGQWVTDRSLDSQMQAQAQSLITLAQMSRGGGFRQDPAATPWPERAKGLDDILLQPVSAINEGLSQTADKAERTDTLWLEFDYFDQTGTLTNVVEYEITQAGKTFTGETSNGTLKLINGVKNSPYDVEFEPTAAREMQTIRRELQKELDASLAQHKKEQSYKAAALDQSSWWEVPFIYGGAVGHGVAQYVEDTAQAGAELVTGFIERKLVAADWLRRYSQNHAEAFDAFSDEDPERLQKELNDIESMHDEVGEAVSDMKENACILGLIALDSECRLMLQDFAEQYGEALTGPEKARFLARHGTDILLMAAAGLGAGIIYLKNAARISKLLKDAANAIEAGRFALAGKFKGLKVKEKHTLQQPKKNVTKKTTVNKSKKKLKPNTPEHKADRWARYQKRGGQKNYDAWSKQYDTNMRNYKYGLERETNYRTAMSAQEGTVKTPLTNRQIDLLKSDKMYAGQLKTGPVSLTKENVLAIQKDAELVKRGWDVEHILEKGASKPYLDALDRAGIRYHIGSKIP